MIRIAQHMNQVFEVLLKSVWVLYTNIHVNVVNTNLNNSLRFLAIQLKIKKTYFSVFLSKSNHLFDQQMFEK